jgi:transcriptional regulator with XRE-family HTH domain
MTSGVKRDPAGPFGVLLADLLDERGMSYGELARRIRVDHGHVTRLMTGERAPSLRTIGRITTALDVADPATRLAFYVAAAETAAKRSETP